MYALRIVILCVFYLAIAIVFQDFFAKRKGTEVPDLIVDFDYLKPRPCAMPDSLRISSSSGIVSAASSVDPFDIP